MSLPAAGGQIVHPALQRCTRCGILTDGPLCDDCFEAPRLQTGRRIFDVLWGVRQAFGQGDLFLWSTAPVLLSVVGLVLGLSYGFGWFNVTFTRWLTLHLPPGFISQVLVALTSVFSFIGAVILFSFLFLPVLGLLCMPFLEPLAGRLEARLLGQRRTATVGIKLLLRESGLLLVFKLVLLLPAFLLAGIPLIGPALFTAVVALTLSLDFLDILWMRRGYSFQEKLDFLKRNLGGWIFFLLPLMLMVWLPLLQLLIVPGAAAGAVRFYLASRK